jgi:hypothetical protein
MLLSFKQNEKKLIKDNILNWIKRKVLKMAFSKRLGASHRYL